MSVSPSSTTPPAGGKRVREDNFESNEIKLKKRKKTKRKELPEDESIDSERGINRAIGDMDSSLLADYVAQRTKRFAADLSAVELEDRRIPESAFSDTSDWKKARILEELPGFLQNCSERSGYKINELSSAPMTPGSPHTLVIASAGLRAADLTRALRRFQTRDAAVAKLFAKHIKLKEAINMVKKTRIGIGVGTPSRVIDLVDSGALSSKALKRIVVDCSHIDQKKRGILDMRETQGPLIQLLNRSELKDRYGGTETDVQLIFY